MGYFEKVLAAIAVLFSIVQLTGFYVDIPGLVTTTPIRFNSALGFFLISTALLLQLYGNKRLAYLFVLLPLIIGCATILQMGLGVDFYINELFYDDPSSYDGLMAVSTAISIILLSISLILPAFFGKLTLWIWGLKACFSGIVLFSGLMALVGYSINANVSYNWFGLGQVSISSVIMQILLGGILIIQPISYFATKPIKNEIKNYAPHFRRRVVVLFFTVLLLIVFIVFLTVRLSYNSYINQTSSELRQQVSSFIDMQQKETSSVIGIVLEYLKNHHDLADLIVLENRTVLEERFEKAFQTLKENYNITHFYFIGVDRKVIIRLHRLDNYGDIINRYTLLEAERTGKRAEGIDMGVHDNITYRVTEPLYHKGKLVGYIEIGKNLEDMIDEAREFLNLDLAVYLYQRVLMTEHFLSKDFKNIAIYHVTSPEYQGSITGYLKDIDSVHSHGGDHKEDAHHLEDEFFIQHVNDKTYVLSHSHFADSEGNILGAIISSKDITLFEYIKRDALLVSAIIIIAVSILLLITVNYVLRVLEKSLKNYQAMLEKQNYELEDTVNLRTAELQEKSSYLSSIFESTVDGIVVINKDGIISDVNSKTCEMFGYKKDELLSQEIEVLMPERFKKHHKGYLQRHLKSERAKSLGIYREIAGISSDGKEFPIEIALSQIISNGDIFFIGLIKDITERKYQEHLLRMSEERFRAMFEKSPVGIALCKMDGTLLQVNRAYGDIIGYSPEECLELTYWDITPESYALKEQEQLDSLYKIGEYGPYRKHYFHRDGYEVPVVLRGVRVKGHEGEDYIWSFVEDITEQKKNQEEIQQYQKELEQHRDKLESLVAEKTHDLTIALEEAEYARKSAEEANQSKSQFLSNMSHELRTPMHAVLSFSRAGLDYVDDDVAKELFADIHQSGDRLLHLLNNLLDLSKLEAGKMTLYLHQNDIVLTVNRIVKELQGMINEKAMTVEINSEKSEMLAEFDNNKMMQVLVNLLSNAIKFTEECSLLTINISYSLLDNQPAVSVSVVDEGIGVPDDELDSVFDKFEQSSKTRTGAGGTGLGLAISQEIINLHHGKIWAQNNPDKGITFTFVIPLEQPQKGDTEED